ncbi:MAG: hypothetical protein FJX77_09880 [Armatimonadetes bacterium]|nr:hypothetical protein [Armatimonadota bacterium]
MSEGPGPEPEPDPPVAAEGRTGRRRGWRPALRALHRDAGYLAVGLTIVYAVSGLAVNHIGHWDPDFVSFRREHQLPPPLPAGTEDLAAAVRTQLGIRETPREVFRAGPDRLDLLFDRRTLHVNPRTGRVLEQGQKSRFFLHLANWLHLNRGKQAWRIIADLYALFLLFLALSGMFMLAGRAGMKGRGGWLVLLGAAVPVLYVVFSGGPGR